MLDVDDLDSDDVGAAIPVVVTPSSASPAHAVASKTIAAVANGDARHIPLPIGANVRVSITTSSVHRGRDEIVDLGYMPGDAQEGKESTMSPNAGLLETTEETEFENPTWREIDERLSRQQDNSNWLVTLRSDGRPHQRPVWAEWVDGKLYFSSGDIFKSRHLAYAEKRWAPTVRDKAFHDLWGAPTRWRF